MMKTNLAFWRSKNSGRYCTYVETKRQCFVDRKSSFLTWPLQQLEFVIRAESCELID